MIIMKILISIYVFLFILLCIALVHLFFSYYRKQSAYILLMLFYRCFQIAYYSLIIYMTYILNYGVNIIFGDLTGFSDILAKLICSLIIIPVLYYSEKVYKNNFIMPKIELKHTDSDTIEKGILENKLTNKDKNYCMLSALIFLIINGFLIYVFDEHFFAEYTKLLSLSVVLFIGIIVPIQKSYTDDDPHVFREAIEALDSNKKVSIIIINIIITIIVTNEIFLSNMPKLFVVIYPCVFCLLWIIRRGIVYIRNRISNLFSFKK